MPLYKMNLPEEDYSNEILNQEVEIFSIKLTLLSWLLILIFIILLCHHNRKKNILLNNSNYYY